jgi:hypothetical protein
MSPQIEAHHLHCRAQQAAEFIANPGLYKACDQCHSISQLNARICFVCGAYRFDESRETVILVSQIIGSSTFPFIAGVVPRLS